MIHRMTAITKTVQEQRLAVGKKFQRLDNLGPSFKTWFANVSLFESKMLLMECEAADLAGLADRVIVEWDHANAQEQQRLFAKFKSKLSSFLNSVFQHLDTLPIDPFENSDTFKAELQWVETNRFVQKRLGLSAYEFGSTREIVTYLRADLNKLKQRSLESIDDVRAIKSTLVNG